MYHTYGPEEIWEGGDVLFLPDGFEKSCKSAIGRSNVMRLYCVCLLNCNMVKGKLATFREKMKDIYIYIYIYIYYIHNVLNIMLPSAL